MTVPLPPILSSGLGLSIPPPPSPSSKPSKRFTPKTKSRKTPAKRAKIEKKSDKKEDGSTPKAKRSKKEKRKMSEGAKAVVGRKHTCSKCQKAFTDTSSLRKHAKIHGEKTFMCQVEGCGKKFIDNSKLKRHQLVHTGERPYACPYPNCRKRFSLDFNLKSHLRIHTGEKPFVCKFEGCGKKFTQVSNLKAHRKTHLKKKDRKKGDSSEPPSPTDSPPLSVSLPSVNSIPPLQLPPLTGGSGPPDYNSVFPSIALSAAATASAVVDPSSLMAQLPGHGGLPTGGHHHHLGLSSGGSLGGMGNMNSIGNMNLGNMNNMNMNNMGFSNQSIPLGFSMLSMSNSLGPGNSMGNVPPPIGTI
jgi:transcription factor YY